MRTAFPRDFSSLVGFNRGRDPLRTKGLPMRLRFFTIAFSILVLTFAVGHDEGYGQQFRGGFQPGSFPPGGFQGGGFQGGKKGMMGGMMGDPSKLFDMLAQGRPYFLITETRSMRDSLTEFAQQRGITD